MKQKILLLCLLSSVFAFSKAMANETEPNNTKAQANTLALNGSNSGVINPTGDQDWWKVTTTSDGRLDLTLTPKSGKYMWVYLYDNDGVTQLNANNSNSTFTLSKDGLAAGTYYVKIITYYSTDTSSYTLSDALVTPTQANDAEPNGTKATAISISANATKTGHINYLYNNTKDTSDWYKITTTDDGALTLTLSSGNTQYVTARLYDNDGTTQLGYVESNSTNSLTTDGLAAGTYYVKINSYYSDGFEPYTLKTSFVTPTQTNDAEPNGTKATALTLALNSKVTGHVDYYYNHQRDSADWYKLTTNGDGYIRLILSSANGQYVNARLYDNDGTTQLNYLESNSTNSINTDGLAAGTYYIKVASYYNDGFVPYTLTDSLYQPAQANDAEPNNNKSTAVAFPVNKTKTGHIDYYYNHQRDSADWYKLSLPTDGMLKLILKSANGQYVNAKLYDYDGTTQLNYIESNSTSSVSTDGLAAGTYYLKIASYYSDGFVPYTITDSLITYAYTADAEPNKYANQAKTLLANTANNGHVGFYTKNVRDTVDWFKINYTGTDGKMTVTLNVAPNFNNSSNYTYLQVYKDTSAAPLFNNYTTTSIATNLTGLTQGYYYVRIVEYYNSNFATYSVTPTFTQANIATIKISSYDSASSCSNVNTITYTAKGSSAPYTFQLYRYGQPYGLPVTKSKNVVFDSLPTGLYYCIVYGDGATGTANAKSKNTSIEPIPTGLSTSGLHSDQALLNWSAVDCAKYFTIQYKAHTSTTWLIKKTDGNVTSYRLKGLTANTMYDWSVAASDSANGIVATGLYAPTISFTTLASGFASTENSSADDAKAVNANTLFIAPNPAINYFNIHYTAVGQDKLIATLFSSTGKAVWTSGSVNADALNNKQVITNNFASGLYYLRITNSKGEMLANTKISINK